MTAYAEFVNRIHQTDTMRELMRSLDEEPTKLFLRICSRHEETGRAVADHYLQLTGYFGEIMLRVLMGAALIHRVSGGRGALLAYEPTEEGMQLYRGMKEENVS